MTRCESCGAPLGDVWLTARECEVLGRLGLGESRKWIRNSLGMTDNTLHRIIDRAYKKLGAHNRAEAVARHPKHKPTPSRACRVTNLSPSRH